MDPGAKPGRSALQSVLLLCGAEVLSMTGFATYAVLLPCCKGSGD